MQKQTQQIDIFKIDCEGCEVELLASQPVLGLLRERVKQLQIEFHWAHYKVKSPAKMHAMWTALAAHGFEPFYKEPNFQWADGSCIEYSLVNLELAKKQGIVQEFTIEKLKSASSKLGRMSAPYVSESIGELQ